MASNARKAKVRSFQFIGGKSKKFWEIVCDGTEVITRWGRIGTEGQGLRKWFCFEGQARAYVETKIAEKLDKGYVEVTAKKVLPRSRKAKAKEEDFMDRLKRKVRERPWEN